jgi:hypothetical protein
VLDDPGVRNALGGVSGGSRLRSDLAVLEVTASYDGGGQVYGVGIHEFRGDKIARERIYVSEGWEPPAWRKKWRSGRPVENPGF